MNSLIQDISKSVQKHIIEGKTPQDILEIIKEKATILLDGYVDFNYFDDVLSFYLNIGKSKPPKDYQERELAFEYTLLAFDVEHNNDILRNDLHALIKYDKIFYSEDVPFFSQLFLVLSFIEEHKKKLTLLNELKSEESLIKRGIAGSKSKYVHEVINPKLNAFEETFQTTNIESVKKFQNLYVAYKDNPFMTDMILRELNSIPQDAIKNSNFASLQKDFFIPSRSFLNSSQTRLDQKDIYESLAINIFLIYRKNSYWNNLMQNTNTLSASRIVKSVNTILEHMLEIDEAKYDYSHVMRETQEKASLFDLPLYEFRTNKNYKQHPIFEVPLPKEFQAILVS